MSINKEMTVKVMQINSYIGRPADQRATLIGLGLKKIGDIRELPDNLSTRGMINKVKHLIKIL
jgi:large subunit ribosomal protein L30